MKGTSKIDSSILKEYLSDFKKEYNSFHSTTYSTFSSCYLKNCSDPYIVRMSNNLSTLYKNIEKGYSNICTWWTDYNKNAKELEDYMSGKGGSGGVAGHVVKNKFITSDVTKKSNTIVSSGNIKRVYHPGVQPKMNVSKNTNSKVLDLIKERDAKIEKVNKWIKDAENGVKKVLSKVGAKVASAGKKTVSYVKKLVKDPIGTLKKTGAYVTSKIKQFSKKFSEKAKTFAKKVGAKVANGAKSLISTVDEWWTDVKENHPWVAKAANGVKKVGKTIVSVGKKVWGVIKRVGATIATFVTSLVEGILKFIEAIVDTVALLGTVVASVITGIFDLGQAIGGAITGKKWSSATKKMWGGTKKFVAKDHVGGAFDKFYEKNPVGNWMKSNAFFFDTTRGIGSGIGYIAGVVVLTICTFGAGSVAAGGGTVTAGAAAAATTTGQMATTAAAAGFGKYAEEAYANGASTGKGLLYGLGGAALEGAQFFIGSKIGTANFVGSKGLAKAGTEGIKTKLTNSAIRVGLDGLDAGAEAFVKPGLNMIYQDGYYDANGNYVKFDENASFSEKYSKLFKQQGGWKGALTQAATGSAFSLLGEGLNLKRYFKNDSTNAKTGTAKSVISDKLQNANDKIKNAKTSLSNKVDSLKSKVNIDKIKGIKEKLSNLKEEAASKTKATVAGKGKKIISKITDKLPDPLEKLKNTKAKITSLKQKITDGVDKVKSIKENKIAGTSESPKMSKITKLKQTISEMKEDPISKVKAKVAEKGNKIISKITDKLPNTSEKLKNTKAKVTSLKQKITDGVDKVKSIKENKIAGTSESPKMSKITKLKQTISEMKEDSISKVKAKVAEKGKKIISKITDKLPNTSEKLKNTKAKVTSLKQKITDGVDKVKSIKENKIAGTSGSPKMSKIKKIKQTISEMKEDSISKVKAKVVEKGKKVVSKLKDKLPNTSEKLKNTKAKVTSLKQKITDKINKLKEIKDAKITNKDVFDANAVNDISKTLEEAGYSFKEIKKLFDNESPEKIMSKYDDALKKLSNAGNKTTVFDQDTINGISKTLEDAGYSLKEINEMFNNESPEQIMSKYDDALKKLSNSGNKTTVFDKNTINGISKTLEDAGYTADQIRKIFNSESPEQIMSRYNNALLKLKNSSTNYGIKNAEIFVDNYKNPYATNSAMYNFYTDYGISGNKIDITSERIDLLKHYYNSGVEIVFWDGTAQEIFSSGSNLDSMKSLYFMNFKIGDPKVKYPLGNSYKIYLPVIDGNSVKNMDSVLDFMVKNDIVSDSKISRSSRSDGIVFRVYDENDAKKVIDFINNNPNINVPNNSLPFSVKYGKVSLAMDGNLSYNSNVAAVYNSYLKTTSNPSISGFKKFVDDILYDSKNKGNYDKLSKYVVNFNYLKKFNGDLSKLLANNIETLDILSVALDEKSNIQNYFDVCRKYQSETYFNNLTADISNNLNNFNGSVSGSSSNVAKSYLQFDRNSKNTAIQQMSNYFGDAGSYVNNMYISGYSTNEIMQSLSSSKKVEFKQFLSNTREGKYLSKLTQEELDALCVYTGSYYSTINDSLRKGYVGSSTVSEYIKNIDSAISKYGGIDADMILHRGVEFDAFTSQSAFKNLLSNTSNPHEMYAQLKSLEGKGLTFSDRAYMSTSPSYSTSFDYKPIDLEIEADKGTKGAYINQISRFYDKENEFLLARGTKMEIKSVELLKVANDYRVVVKCKVVN